MGKRPATSIQPNHTRVSPRVLVITGLSGSGKTVALRAVEDAGFFCVDNLPVSLISALITRLSGRTGVRNVAVGVDVRERVFLDRIETSLNSLRRKHRIEILFLEAEPEALVRRFRETRRPHPLGGEFSDAIRLEQEILAPLRNHADRVVDTSLLSPHQLRKLITSFYAPQKNRKELSVTLLSFGFKYGVPQNIDLLFDARFLPNPHFVPHLKDLTGRDRDVADYVLKSADSRRFLKKIVDLLRFLIPHFVREGRSYVSIAVGCTGGRHRSPAIVEELSKALVRRTLDLNVIHRDLPI